MQNNKQKYSAEIEKRNSVIRKLAKKGFGVRFIAEQYNLSEVFVYKIIGRQKDNAAPKQEQIFKSPCLPGREGVRYCGGDRCHLADRCPAVRRWQKKLARNHDRAAKK